MHALVNISNYFLKQTINIFQPNQSKKKFHKENTLKIVLKIHIRGKLMLFWWAGSVLKPIKGKKQRMQSWKINWKINPVIHTWWMDHSANSEYDWGLD